MDGLGEHICKYTVETGCMTFIKPLLAEVIQTIITFCQERGAAMKENSDRILVVVGIIAILVGGIINFYKIE